MTTQPLTGILIALVFILTINAVVMWQRNTRGLWRRYPAGRAFMSLLLVQTVILGLATASTWLGDWPGREWMYVVVYVLLVVAIGRVNWTIYDLHRHPPEDAGDPAP